MRGWGVRRSGRLVRLNHGRGKAFRITGCVCGCAGNWRAADAGYRTSDTIRGADAS